MEMITIASVRPILAGRRYEIWVEATDGERRPIRLTYNSFRLLLILAIRAMRDKESSWATVSELSGSNTGRYLYRLRHELALEGTPILNNGRRGQYRWNTEAIKIQVTPTAWSELAEFSDETTRRLTKSDDDLQDESQTDERLDKSRAYARQYYRLHREKALEYQKMYTRIHRRRESHEAPFKQLRQKQLDEVHRGHIQHATGDRLISLIDDICAGRRTLIGGM